MKPECSIVRDLLPLYAEDMVSEQTARYIEDHLKDCPACRAELDSLKEGSALGAAEAADPPATEGAKSFKKLMKRMSRPIYILSYSLLVCFVFLGFGLTEGEHLMYNSLIMPIVGVFGYVVFGWRSLYKVPLLLLGIDVFVCLFGLVALELYDAFMWTLIYSGFVWVGIAIAFLLHYAFRKEK